MSLFTTSEILLKHKEERATSFYLSNFNPNTVLGTRLKDLESKIGNPDESKVINYVTDGAWSMHHLLAYLVQKCGNSRVYVSTWRMSEESLRVIQGLKSVGLIKEFNLIISDRMKSHNPQEHQLAKEVCDRLVFAKNHSKVLVIRGEHCTATVISTANFSTNRRIESGVIFYDWKISAFNKGWMENVLEGKGLV